MNAPTLLDKWRFLDAVVRSPGLAALDIRLSFRFLDYFDPQRGGAWPSLDTLAADLSVSKRACIDAVGRLEAAGWFVCDRRRRRGNVYRPAWGKVKPTSLIGDEYVNHTSLIHGEQVKPASLTPESISEVERMGKVKPTSPDSSYRTPLIERSLSTREVSGYDASELVDADHQHQTHQPDNQQHRGNQPNAKARKADQGAEEFEGWWTLYPRKIGKGAARTAYARARKKASAEELEAAARRFAELMTAERREMRYVPHPTTWLNQERWADVPAGTTQAHEGPTISRGTRAAMEAFGRAAQRHAEEVDQ